MKKMQFIFIPIMAFSLLVSCGTKIPSIYHTIDEWKENYKILNESDYQENKKLSAVPENEPIAKCKNGTFVGQLEDDVNVFKGVPYAKTPIGDLRFKKSVDPDDSNDVYEAKYFGMSCLQKDSENEPASLYKKGEDCLRLNVWNSTRDKSSNKPVLVYIHGGGWNSGGTCDPLYNGFYFAHYNPGVILVTITYRFNILGLVNLAAVKENGEHYFDDYTQYGEGDKNPYYYSVNNAIWDQVQALKYIHNNIAAFGGDPNNVTISGESAGGGAVSILCTIPEAQNYFQKAYAMSGTVNQISEENTSLPLIDAIQTKDNDVTYEDSKGNEYTWEGYNEISQLVSLPEGLLQAFWGKHETQYQHPVRGAGGIDIDPFSKWEDGTTKNLTILQGYTRNEFRYYQHVFNEYEEMYDAVCRAMQYIHSIEGGDNYRGMWNNYHESLLKKGYTDKEIYRIYADDFTFNTACDYQAEMHAKNGGKGYCYIFDKGYDGVLEYLGAAHAVDCFYLFGAFNGKGGEGTNEEVDFSRNFQSMIANFCKKGEPASNWEPYNGSTRKKMIINFKNKTEENPEGDRVKKALNMFNAKDIIPGTKTSHYVFRYTKPLGPVVGVVAQNDFNIFRTWSIMSSGRDPLDPTGKYTATIFGDGATLKSFEHVNDAYVATVTTNEDYIFIDAVTTSLGFELYSGSYSCEYVGNNTIYIYFPANMMIDDVIIYATVY
ncbi:MAG: carboxylesterase family protein [Bacilli bacterium]|nr:carboxylesterase family protein [Bacilli bacterium]